MTKLNQEIKELLKELINLNNTERPVFNVKTYFNSASKEKFVRDMSILNEVDRYTIDLTLETMSNNGSLYIFDESKSIIRDGKEYLVGLLLNRKDSPLPFYIPNFEGLTNLINVFRSDEYKIDLAFEALEKYCSDNKLSDLK